MDTVYLCPSSPFCRELALALALFEVSGYTVEGDDEPSIPPATQDRHPSQLTRVSPRPLPPLPIQIGTEALWTEQRHKRPSSELLPCPH
jgi:hypothetical protein